MNEKSICIIKTKITHVGKNNYWHAEKGTVYWWQKYATGP